VLDAISSTIESKISYINKRITNYILDNETIKNTATAEGCTDDVFDEDDSYQGSIYYPQDGENSSGCEDGGITITLY
jgi:hypothetical protein